MPRIDQSLLRECPRCACGLLPTSAICEFCGGVLSHIAAVDNQVSGIICPNCGKENGATAVTCSSCAKPLVHSCPKCAEPLAANALSCLKCGLSRTGFFEECVQQRVEARDVQARTLRRRALIDDIVGFAIVGVFILVAWWQGLRSDAWEWKAWLGVTVWYLVMWALAKSK